MKSDEDVRVRILLFSTLLLFSRWLVQRRQFYLQKHVKSLLLNWHFEHGCILRKAREELYRFSNEFNIHLENWYWRLHLKYWYFRFSHWYNSKRWIQAKLSTRSSVKSSFYGSVELNAVWSKLLILLKF